MQAYPGQSLLAMVARETDNLVIITDRDGLTEWVNPGFTRLTGYTTADLRGKKPGQVLQGAETDRQTVEAIRAAIAERRPIRTEILNYTRAGRPYWLEIHIQPVFDAKSGELTHYIAIELDVTEKRRLYAQVVAARDRAEEQVRRQVAELAAAQIATIVALAKLAESRDSDTGRHLERVQAMCEALATHLRGHDAGGAPVGDSFIGDIRQSAPLHDIGKVGIPDHILLKPGRLDEREWAIMRQHPLIGAETLQAVLREHPGNTFVRMGIEIARHHHEHWDGTGYPDGLAGPRIPLAARIMAVVDVYDALRSRRPYKPGFSHEETMKELARGRGAHFDPAVLECFMVRQSDFDRLYHLHADP